MARCAALYLRCRGTALATWFLAERFGQFRNDLEQISNQAYVGDFEYRRFLVLVDCDDSGAMILPV